MTCVKKRIQPKTDVNEGLAVLNTLNLAQKAREKGTDGPVFPDDCSYFVHPTAILDASAKIGKASKIWNFSHIMSGAKIGERCKLGQN